MACTALWWRRRRASGPRCGSEDRGHVVGVANHTNFLRAVRSGRLTAVATPIHRGRTQQLWQVVITDDAGRELARGEVRLAKIASPAVLGRDSGTAQA